MAQRSFGGIEAVLIISLTGRMGIQILPAADIDPDMTVAELFCQGPILIEWKPGDGQRVQLQVEAPKELKVWRVDTDVPDKVSGANVSETGSPSDPLGREEPAE